MTSLTAPFLVYNLGCEMIFIIEQRLRAQNSSQERAATVLLDLAEGLLRQDQMEELFTAQPRPHIAHIYDKFLQLAHSTVMRLSTTSMDRLYDLMLMGVKFMVCGCVNLESLLQSSLWHLDGVKATLDNTGSKRSTSGSGGACAFDLLEACKAKFVRTYGTLSVGQLHLLRTELLHFFCSSRIKVSMYLTEGIQDPEGQFFLRKPVRAQGVPVGTVKTTRDGKYTVDRVDLGFMEEPDANFFCHPMTLGDNMYRQDRIAVMPPPRSDGFGPGETTGRSRTVHSTAAEHKPSAYAGTEQPGQLHRLGTVGSKSTGGNASDIGDKAEDSRARSEVQLLSALSSMKVRQEAAKLDLFIDDDVTERVEPPLAPQESNVVRVESHGHGAYASQMGGVACFLEGQRTSEGKLDLLALMDDAQG
eukprot:jgi/Ulvmu1/9837/UM056_0078.1